MQLIHEELALQWVVSNGPTREKAMSESWFFFELMVKSMAEYLSVAELINAPRKQRFPSQFTDDCTALVVMITKEIVEKHHVVSHNNVHCINTLECSVHKHAVELSALSLSVFVNGQL